MRKLELIAPCHFGMEAVLKREIQDLGYEISRVEDGRVTFIGDEEAVAYANIFLRTTERILIQIGRVDAVTFDELFEKTRDLPWEEYIPADGKFWVAKANSVKSKLFSPFRHSVHYEKSHCGTFKRGVPSEWFPETGASFPLRVAFMKDEAVIGLDTSEFHCINGDIGS